MRYLGKTFSYLKGNILLPVTVMIAPSIAACFLSTPYWEVTFVAAFDYDPYLSAGKTFAVMFGDSWRFAWPVLIIAALQIFAAALLMSAMDRHFRTGRLSLKNPWRLVNYSIFPVALGVALMCAISILWRFLLFGLVMLIQVGAQAMSWAPSAALAVIGAVAVGMFVLHVLILVPMLYWSPVMFVYGYRFRDAAASSFKLVSGRKLLLGLLLPLTLCAGMQLLMAFSGVHISVTRIVGFVVFLFTNVYVTVYVMLSFYDISGLPRRDLKPYSGIPVTVEIPVKQEEKQTADRQPDAAPQEKPHKRKTARKKPKDGKSVKETKEENGSGV